MNIEEMLKQVLLLSNKGLSSMDRAFLNGDRACIDQIAPHVHRLSQDELTLMFDVFEYVSPTGLNSKPVTPELRIKLQALAKKFKPQRFG